LFLTGCSAKTPIAKFEEVKRAQPHTFEIAFNHPKLCRAFFIQNNEIRYELKETGTYEITPGEYLFIAFCPNAFRVEHKYLCKNGEKSIIAFAPGAKIPQIELGLTY
jgi:hypothetical protein